ncbi:hypothetical protein [Bowmanella sp. JS7-9]|uniref:Phage shock protein B n=1 Tax=Pseudobowmanella zhangzhouensis TaxID=1537679 RepID=A0ABW1XL49_9ALTE|nr:hypothetical protein [Bowmanella sp. JS7-9]TBX22607.1 hypothetical protein TK45_09255 [Bowmanella sp. JS7-9]
MNLTSIGIIAILTWGMIELVKQFKRGDSKQNSKTVNELQSQVQQLRERVEVLEKIVTDNSYDLKKQFDNLKD